VRKVFKILPLGLDFDLERRCGRCASAGKRRGVGVVWEIRFVKYWEPVRELVCGGLFDLVDDENVGGGLDGIDLEAELLL
jgi:hypothetical protein